MKNPLDTPVLVLNKGWLAHEMHSAQHILPMLFTGVCTALDIGDSERPMRWDDWVKLPIRPGDDVIHTPKFSFRCPTVVVLATFDKAGKTKLKKNLRGVAARDGNRCQYSGRKLQPHEMSIDHVHAKSKGGTDEWTNIVLADKAINHRKGNKTNKEAGLKLLRKPVEPKEMPRSFFLHAAHPDHQRFLQK